MYCSNGLKASKYSIRAMYSDRPNIGGLYFIEVKEGHPWLGIGDATFSETTLPIGIGIKAYWGRGIGKQVISAFIDKARQNGMATLGLKEIYAYNKRSYNLFTSLGFIRFEDGTFRLDI